MVLGVMEGQSRGSYFPDCILDPSVIDCTVESTVGCTLGWLTKKIEGKKPPLFLPQLPKQAQLPKREASMDCLAYASSSTLGLKTPFFLSKSAVFRPNVELEA